jgi:rubrerythrin
MATTVGTETDLNLMLTHLVKRELDAIAAYEAAIARIRDTTFRDQLKTYRDDHRRCAEELSLFLIAADQPVPSRGDMKRVVTEGKVLLAKLAGDRAILRAIRSNEDDAAHAYGRAINHPDSPPSLRDVLRSALHKQHRHCAWIDERLHRLH